MRNREMTPEGDYQFGAGSVWLIDSPAAVAQAIKTRLGLLKKEWFLDLREGLDMDAILGFGTQVSRDREIKTRIAGTRGVKRITRYASEADGQTRHFTVAAVVDTIYGPVTITEVF